MQFAKLRLSGFKSFVESTEFVIEPGLTGVVGPNGCGKSNLVEALRWVMGENRVRQMRGGEMDDVIFAGTSGRPARNVAEVALYIDNATRNAPAPFNDMAEFEVVRRIERGSGSAYRVGGRDVRARDVQLLFADAASGAHSPALVSQGRIGAIIAAKPTERRVLLEEAAGIAGLHSRRHEAELKLKAAEANLARLDDVLMTLDTQYQGLKKQARQAARYRNMSVLIRKAEGVLYALKWRDANEACAAAEARLAAAERAVADVTGRAAAAAARLADAEALLPDLRRTEAEAAQALARLAAERDVLVAEEQRVAQAIRDLEARRRQLAADADRERSHAADSAAALQRLAAEAAASSDAEAAATERAATLKSELDDARGAVEALDRDVALATELVAAAEAERTALGRAIRDLEQRSAALAARRTELANEKARVEALAADTAALDAAAAEVARLEAALEAARARATAAETARRAAQEEETGARGAWTSADAERTRLDAEAGALAAILASETLSLASGFTPVIDELRVQPGFEAALGAALGDDLAAPTDPTAPTHWREIGLFEVGPALPAQTRPLSDFVTAPTALLRRLAQIGVIDDGADGAAMAMHLAQGQRLVDRAGMLWRWDGFVRAAGKSAATVARLAQRNRLNELRPLQTVANETAEGAKTRFDGAKAALAAATAEDQAARNAVSGAINGLESGRGRHAAVARKAAELANQIAGIADRLARAESDFAEVSARKSEADARLAEIPDPAPRREQLAQDRTQLAALRAALAQLESENSRLERDRIERARRRQAIAADEAQWQSRAAAAERQLGVLAERQREADEEAARLAQRPAEIAAERTRIFDLLAQAEAARGAAGDRLAEAETAVAEAARDLRAVETELGSAREERVRTEAGAQQAAERREQLRAEIADRLGCTPEQTLEVGEVDTQSDLPELAQIEGRLQRLVKERDTMGPVNLRADEEAAELEQQIQGMQAEKNDLVQAIARLRQGISSLNREGRERLRAAFETVNKHFQELFVRLFGGGRAHLSLAAVEEGKDDDPLEAGLEVMASPPGKKLQTLSLLSGGEQALTALSLLFAVFLTNPAPICVLDEVDAPLDDANVDRFCRLLEEIARSTGTRFLVVTHHRLTMAKMHRLFGVTMAERGISQLVSVDLQAAERIRATA